MASSKKDGREQLDELLAQLRDRTLTEDETIVAQAQGDHGQGVVLTSKRVLVLKAGITATGKIDGVVVGEFPFESIASVKVRKGPLGAVIQICPSVQDLLAQGDVPNNVVVFTGPKRVKKCEWIAARIESALGKPLECTEAPEDQEAGKVILDFGESGSSPHEEDTSSEDLTAVQHEQAAQTLDEVTSETKSASDTAQLQDETVPNCESSTAAEKPRSNRRTSRSLADEIYSEVLEARANPSPAERHQEYQYAEPEDRSHIPSADSSDGTPAETAKPISNRPGPQDAKPNVAANPRLPKPVKRRVQRDKALTLLALLFVALIAGIAAIAPSRYGAVAPTQAPAQESAAQDVQLLHKHLQKVSEYKQSVSVYVAKAVEYLQTVESAARSGDRSALAALAAQQRLDAVLQRVESIDAPVGLAAAKEHILAGLALAQTAIVKLSVGQQSSLGADIRDCLRELGEAKNKLTRGLAAIDNVRSEIEHRSLKAAPAQVDSGGSTEFSKRKTLPANNSR